YLGFATKDFIIKEFGSLITVAENGSIKINLLAGIIAWIAISAMVVTFVTFKYDNYTEIIFYGALLGFLSYTMYDFTNLTFINNYSLKFAIADVLWGSFVCSMIALNSFYFYNLIK
ncbi:MAG: DUF2177 family protein, partial [Candidatus Absconditabacteria bacterium]